MNSKPFENNNKSIAVGGMIHKQEPIDNSLGVDLLDDNQKNNQEDSDSLDDLDISSDPKTPLLK